MNPTFDKLIGWHPKDTSERRSLHAICASPEGVFVLEHLSYGNHNLRQYDHDGNYVKTIYPWDPDILDRIIIPKRTMPDAKMWRKEQPPAGSNYVPILHHYGACEPFGFVQSPTCMAVAVDKIGLYTQGGCGNCCDCVPTARPAANRSAAATPTNTPVPPFAGQAHITLSPDGKWVYVSGLGRADRQGKHRDMRLERPPYTWNAVFKFAWDDTGVVVEGRDAFAGEVSRDPKKAGAGRDNQHFDAPQGLACDAAGRLYVADHNNNRVQIFSPDGKYPNSCGATSRQLFLSNISASRFRCWRSMAGARRRGSGSFTKAVLSASLQSAATVGAVRRLRGRPPPRGLHAVFHARQKDGLP